MGDIFLPTWKQAITDFTLRDRKCTAAVFRWAAGPGPPPPSSVLGTSACAFVSESSQSGHGLPSYLLQTQPCICPTEQPAWPRPALLPSAEPAFRVSSNPACARDHVLLEIRTFKLPTFAVFIMGPGSRPLTLYTLWAENRIPGKQKLARPLGQRDPAQSGVLCLTLGFRMFI